MNGEREWLLVIHCSNHRLDLTMKDAFEADDCFADVDQILLDMYLITKNSGKVKRLLKAVALSMDVICMTFVKSQGTRFQNHKYRAIKSFIVNYLPASLLFENYVEAGNDLAKGATLAKIRGWLSVFRQYKFLASLNFYFKTLHETAHLAYLMQGASTMVTDIKDGLKDALNKLTALENEEICLPFDGEEINGKVVIRPSATNLPANQQFKKQNQLSEKQKARALRCVNIHREEFEVERVSRDQNQRKTATCYQILHR